MRTTIVCLLLAACALLDSGCSYLTASGRREAAYARYVRRQSAGRVKMQRKLLAQKKPQRIPNSMPSEPMETTSLGPESMTAGDASAQVSQP